MDTYTEQGDRDTIAIVNADKCESDATSCHCYDIFEDTNMSINRNGTPDQVDGEQCPNPGKCRAPDHVNVNHYSTKKTVATGLLDLAIFTSNASRLWSLIQAKHTDYYYAILVMLIVILSLQVATGVLLLLIGKADIRKKQDRVKLDGWNNIATLGIFVITIMNILISSFSASTKLQ